LKAVGLGPIGEDIPLRPRVDAFDGIAATIKAGRTATAKREDSWTQAELLKVP